MNIITLDAETYYDNDFTLSKMSTEAYVRDPRLEVHGWAWRNQNAVGWLTEEQFLGWQKQIDWAQTAVLCHHAQFDGLILSHRYGIKPAFWFDTLSMARMLLGNHLSVGLDSLAKHYGLAAKTVPYNLFKGKHWRDLGVDVQRLVAEGAVHDCELTWQLFGILGKNFPREEYQVIDTVVRMFTQPVLGADVDLLAKIWEDEAKRKITALAQLGVTESDLQSADRFAALLRKQGVEPEMKDGKVSEKTGKSKRNYAFAKTDDFMRSLMEHDSDEVRLLAETRLGVKSTIMQTRAETLGWMASRGPLPVYLRMYGAGTLRVSGGDGANWLNFKRRSPIRRAIKAPDGFLLGPIDASQIECRVLHYLAGGEDEPVIEKFRNNEDPYVDLASQFYGEKIYKPAKGDPRYDEMDAKRGMGKQGRLMCGYGAAGKQFKQTAKNGLYGPPVEISIEDAAAFVKLYRDTNPSVCGRNTGYWAQCGRALARLGGGPSQEWGPLTIRDHRIYLPNGTALIYDTLEYFKPEPEDAHLYKEYEQNGFWRVRTRQGWKTMWGSKLTQNICEAVSRVIVSQAMNRITAMGYRVLNWPYDELLCLIPRDGREAQHLERCRLELCKDVVWLPGLPLDAEAHLGERYSK